MSTCNFFQFTIASAIFIARQLPSDKSTNDYLFFIHSNVTVVYSSKLGMWWEHFLMLMLFFIFAIALSLPQIGKHRTGFVVLGSFGFLASIVDLLCPLLKFSNIKRFYISYTRLLPPFWDIGSVKAGSSLITATLHLDEGEKYIIKLHTLRRGGEAEAEKLFLRRRL